MALNMSAELNKKIDKHIKKLISKLIEEDRLGKTTASAISREFLVIGFPDRDIADTFLVFKTWVEKGSVASAFDPNINSILEGVKSFLTKLDSNNGDELLMLKNEQQRAKVKTYTYLYLLNMLHQLKQRSTLEGIEEILLQHKTTLQNILAVIMAAKNSGILDESKSKKLIAIVETILSDLAKSNENIRAFYNGIVNAVAKTSDYYTPKKIEEKNIDALVQLLNAESMRLSADNATLISEIMNACNVSTIQRAAGASNTSKLEQLGINTMAPASTVILRINLTSSESEVIDLLGVIAKFKIHFAILAETLNAESKTKKDDIISLIEIILAQIAELQIQIESYTKSAYKNPLHLQNMQSLFKILLNDAIPCLKNIVVNNQIEERDLTTSTTQTDIDTGTTTAQIANESRASEAPILAGLVKSLFDTNMPGLQPESSITASRNTIEIDTFFADLLKGLRGESFASPAAAASAETSKSTEETGEEQLDRLLEELSPGSSAGGDISQARLKASAAALGSSSAFNFGGDTPGEKAQPAEPAIAAASTAPVLRPGSSSS